MNQTCIQLRSFSLSDEWLPLLVRLGGWKKIADRLYSDGDSIIRLTQPSNHTLSLGFFRPPIGEGPETLFSASGLEVRIEDRPFFATAPRNSRFVMNHAAIQVPEVDPERIWFESLLGPSTVLQRESTWDPVAKMSWPDAHLFRPPDFYLTIRGGFEVSAVDHIGWMLDSASTVDFTASILAELDWPILFGPDLIDGSYLVHFRGPDSRIHDFFFPTDAVIPGRNDP